MADTVLAELTFGLPSRSQDPFMMQQLFLRLHEVSFAVRCFHILKFMLFFSITKIVLGFQVLCEFLKKMLFL